MQDIPSFLKRTVPAPCASGNFLARIHTALNKFKDTDFSISIKAVSLDREPCNPCLYKENTAKTML